MQFQFDNGWGLSVQQSEAHYSSATTFEVAVTHHERICDRNLVAGMWDGNVKGWQTAKNVLDLLVMVDKLDPVNECNHRRHKEVDCWCGIGHKTE